MSVVDEDSDQDDDDDTGPSLNEELRKVIGLGWMDVKVKTKKGQLRYPFPVLPKLAMDPSYHALKTCVFFVWDPVGLLADDMQGATLCCPTCSSTLVSKGYGTSSIRIERGAGSSANLLVAVDLKCNKCASANGSCRYTSVHPDILKQLPDTVREQFPFVATPNGAFLSVEMLNRVMTEVECGVSFQSIHRSLLNSICTLFMRRELNRRRLFEDAMKKTFYGGPRLLPEPSVHKYAPAFVLTAKLASKFFVQETQRQEGLIQKTFLNAVVASSSLHIDMTFPWGNDGSKSGETGLWVMLNGFGEVVAVRSATSKSLDEAAGLLSQINEYARDHDHRIKVVFTDNPDIDAGTLRRAFGDDVCICKDVFHVMAALFDCTKKTAKNRLGWECCVVNAFYWFPEEDVAKERGKLEKAKVKDIDKLLSRASFLRSRCGIRHILRKPDEIVKHLKAAIAEFQILGVFSKDSDKILRPIVEGIPRYLDIPEDYAVHVNVGTEEEPVWRYSQGTSLVECFNRFSNAVHLERFSMEVGSALVTRLAYTFSHSQRINFRSLDLVQNMTDLALQNDLIVQQKVLLTNGWMSETSVLFDKVQDIKPLKDKALFTSGLFHPIGSFVDKSLKYLTTGSREDIPRHVSKRFDYRQALSDLQKPIRGVTPFTTAAEKELLVHMLRSERFYKSKGKQAVFDANGAFCLDRLLESADRGHLDETIDIQTLCFVWNITFLVDEVTEMAWEDYTVTQPEQIFAKESVHFKLDLQRLAKAAASRRLPPIV